MKFFYTVCFALLGINSVLFAQTAADSVLAKDRLSPVKTMSYEQYQAYFTGQDINNLGAVAEVNHYPSPQKTLDLKKELMLTAAQVTAITAINTEIQRKLKEMGGMIIKNETVINNLFKSKKPDDGTIIFYVNRYGLYEGELRNAILQTYLKTQALLTPVQLTKYRQLQKP